MKAILSTGIAVLVMIATPAVAQDRAGSVQVKVLGTAVLPDGEIDVTSVDTSTTLGAAAAGITSPFDTAANDNVVPTVAIEYFFTNNLSVETICCMTQHDVDGTGALAGAEMVSNARLIPATLTAKYHVDAGAFKPYVGVGATYFLWVSDKPGAFTVAADVTDTDLSDEFGFVLQGGVDIPLGDGGFGISLDAKKYFVDTTARWYEGSTLALESEHKLDPWVLSAGVTFSF